MKLSNIILEDFGGYTKFKPQSEKLEAELRNTYNREDIHVKIGQYHERDRGFGKVDIDTREELAPSEYNNMKNYIEAKGYEITRGANFADDDGDRYYNPTIKFEFDIQ